MTTQETLARRTLLRWRNSPASFVREALTAVPHPWQEKALAAIAGHARVAIRSGHGVGKSALLAWTALWWMLTRFPARIAATAPTAHQLHDVLWGEIAKWREGLPAALKDRLALKSERLELAEAPALSFAAARTARKGEPESFQGFHAAHMLLLADEASGIEDALFEAAQGALSTPNAKAALASNPTRPDGFFHATFHRLRARWRTMKVSSLEVAGARGHVPDILAAYGEDSNAYRVRVLGEFPTSADEAAIPLPLIEAAAARAVEGSDAFRALWGLDVARFGEDRTALAKRRGNLLLEPVLAWRGRDTMQTAGRVMAEWQATSEPERPAEILVDVIGLGAGVVDRLRELGLPARGINVAESPADSARFARLRDELWWKAREWFEARDCAMPRDESLIAELASPTYGFTSAGRIVIEGKDELARRGIDSPDLADAFVLTFAGAAFAAAPRAPRERYRARRGGGQSWMTA